MRNSILSLPLLFFGFVAKGQFHDSNIKKISSLEEAKEYADRYREVSFGLVNSEMDVFLFDNVNVSDMKSSIGEEYTIYRRRTKFLKDTSIMMANVQVVEFDLDRIGLDSANNLMHEMIRNYKNESSYWSLLKKYQNESCKFNGGPISTDLLNKRFGTKFENRAKDDIFIWRSVDQPDVPVLIIIHQEAHPVPAFYAISYNVAG